MGPNSKRDTGELKPPFPPASLQQTADLQLMFGEKELQQMQICQAQVLLCRGFGTTGLDLLLTSLQAHPQLQPSAEEQLTISE